MPGSWTSQWSVCRGSPILRISRRWSRWKRYLSGISHPLTSSEARTLCLSRAARIRSGTCSGCARTVWRRRSSSSRTGAGWCSASAGATRCWDRRSQTRTVRSRGAQWQAWGFSLCAPYSNRRREGQGWKEISLSWKARSKNCPGRLLPGMRSIWGKALLQRAAERLHRSQRRPYKAASPETSFPEMAFP